VLPDDEIMLITEGGTLVRTTVAEIPVLSRNTQGVKLIDVAGEERLAGVERIVALDGDDEDDADSDG
jgi:DNA gyrase subunit A